MEAIKVARSQSATNVSNANIDKLERSISMDIIAVVNTDGRLPSQDSISAPRRLSKVPP